MEAGAGALDLRDEAARLIAEREALVQLSRRGMVVDNL